MMMMLSIGSRNAKPVTYQGHRYPSITALARRYGLTPKVVMARLERGQALERAR